MLSQAIGETVIEGLTTVHVMRFCLQLLQRLRQQFEAVRPTHS